MGGRGLENLFQISLKMAMQSDPSQLAANSPHGTTASRAQAWDSKRKVPVIFHSIRAHLPSGWGRDFLLGAPGREKGRRKQKPKQITPSQEAFCICPGWVGGLTRQRVCSWLSRHQERELLAPCRSRLGPKLLHPLTSTQNTRWFSLS